MQQAVLCNASHEPLEMIFQDNGKIDHMPEMCVPAK